MHINLGLCIISIVVLVGLVIAVHMAIAIMWDIGDSGFQYIEALSQVLRSVHQLIILVGCIVLESG